MKPLLYISLLFFSIHCFGQTETKEDFLNEIDTAFVGANSSYLLLSNDAFPVRLRKGSYERNDLEELSQKIDTIVIQQLINNSLTDTIDIQWDYSRLKLARCMDKLSVPRAVEKIYLINYEKRWWPKIYRKHYEKKRVSAQDKIWAALPPEEKVAYYFSRPIFDNKKEFGIIHMVEVEGPTKGYSCIYLYKHVNNHWEKIAEIHCMLS